MKAAFIPQGEPSGRLPGVMQLVDSLAVGGLERVAVNLANLLPRDRYESHLCATRAGGPLAGGIQEDVKLLQLGRKGRLDLGAIRRLRAYLHEQRIQIVHAHGTSLFLAVAASLLNPGYPRVIWHDHYGNHATAPRSRWLYRVAVSQVRSVITVNQTLAAWARDALKMPAERIRYVPNFAVSAPPSHAPLELPGKPGARLVCVANLRPQKDHENLLHAFRLLLDRKPDAHLLLVGSTDDVAQRARYEELLGRLELEDRVSHLGLRQDVSRILAECDVGVLASRSEGLPLALIEYGLAGLPSVVTDVGQCREVLDDGRLGLLVPSEQPDALGDAFARVLDERESRKRWGEPFRDWVARRFSSAAALEQVCEIYQAVAAPR